MKRRRLSSTSSAGCESSIASNSKVKTSSAALEIVTLHRSVSPPPVRKRLEAGKVTKSATAKVEAGEATVQDHVGFFASSLLAATLPEIAGQPRLSHAAWLALYGRNSLNDQGHHFVIHQHDHPIAGLHYDLRLQCNATSSLSFAIMYGLPGDPNSRRLNRNATETRVHNLWNHLIETASLQTGTMLIWDTGEYEILPDSEPATGAASSSSSSSSEEEDSESDQLADQHRLGWQALCEPERLAHAFSNRKIRVRLHGTRLPRGYTISMRLTRANFRSTQPPRPLFRRGRGRGPGRGSKRGHAAKRSRGYNTSSDHSDSDSGLGSEPGPGNNRKNNKDSGSDIDNDNDTIHTTNAYPGGAVNSTNSIYQRKWFLSLDRRASGFIPSTSTSTGSGGSHHVRTWIRRPPLLAQPEEEEEEEEEWNDNNNNKNGGLKAFHVLGRDHERSVVTGRLAADILRDERVENFVPRAHWRAILE